MQFSFQQQINVKIRESKGQNKVYSDVESLTKVLIIILIKPNEVGLFCIQARLRMSMKICNSFNKTSSEQQASILDFTWFQSNTFLVELLLCKVCLQFISSVPTLSNTCLEFKFNYFGTISRMEACYSELILIT